MTTTKLNDMFTMFERTSQDDDVPRYNGVVIRREVDKFVPEASISTYSFIVFESWKEAQKRNANIIAN